ncbi:hypothetical protein Goshw_016741 [Gossypium schwendimanii]|uniref:Uncharacterized protein n=1 Tax=Gossypium schwendimanii TaxID=34291 RepID=A0A7J9MC34_GOSSC|nr:hypothetical protein [Gossypium schwendimanii]
MKQSKLNVLTTKFEALRM